MIMLQIIGTVLVTAGSVIMALLKNKD